MNTVNLFVTTGGGPAECRVALSKLLVLLTKQAAAEGRECHVKTIFEGDRHGPKSVIVEIAGTEAAAFAKRFDGSLQFVFQSQVRPNHRRKNWFLSAVPVELPSPSAVDEVREEDVTFETFQAGGAGGQHQNKTDSAVRLRHAPSGIVIVSRNERSQHQNKRIALKGLAEALALVRENAKKDSAKSIFALSKNIERGNPVRVFKD
jgi:peptide chain release factor